MSKKIGGIVVPIITPVDECENVAESELRALLRHCVDGGIHGIFIAGSNGECMALTQKERDRAIKIALDEVGSQVPVLCGTMDSSTRRVIDNVKRLEDMGGKYAVITPVFYARHATQNESIRLFEEVSAKTNAELLIYNIPAFTGEKLTPETIFEIAKIDRVIGYKDSSGSLSDFIRCLEHFNGSDFILLEGSMNLSTAAMLIGADGCIPAMAPLFPELFVRLYDSCMNREVDTAMRYNKLVNMTAELWKCTKNQTTATKYALSLLGLCGSKVISPTEPITPTEAEEIKVRLSRITDLVKEELSKN